MHGDYVINGLKSAVASKGFNLKHLQDVNLK